MHFFWRLFNLSAGKKYVIPESELNCYYSERSRATTPDYSRNRCLLAETYFFPAFRYDEIIIPIQYSILSRLNDSISELDI